MHWLINNIMSWLEISFTAPDRRQSKTLDIIDERGSKIDRNSVFDCHLSPVGRQMAIETPVSYYFDLRLSIG